jgi:hypothetical protein
MIHVADAARRSLEQALDEAMDVLREAEAGLASPDDNAGMAVERAMFAAMRVMRIKELLEAMG